MCKNVTTIVSVLSYPYLFKITYISYGTINHKLFSKTFIVVSPINKATSHRSPFASVNAIFEET